MKAIYSTENRQGIKYRVPGIARNCPEYIPAGARRITIMSFISMRCDVIKYRVPGIGKYRVPGIGKYRVPGIGVPGIGDRVDFTLPQDVQGMTNSLSLPEEGDISPESLEKGDPNNISPSLFKRVVRGVTTFVLLPAVLLGGAIKARAQGPSADEIQNGLHNQPMAGAPSVPGEKPEFTQNGHKIATDGPDTERDENAKILEAIQPDCVDTMEDVAGNSPYNPANSCFNWGIYGGGAPYNFTQTCTGENPPGHCVDHALVATDPGGNVNLNLETKNLTLTPGYNMLQLQIRVKDPDTSNSGVVVEVSNDNGVSWFDVHEVGFNLSTTPPYNGGIGGTAQRSAYVGPDNSVSVTVDARNNIFDPELKFRVVYINQGLDAGGSTVEVDNVNMWNTPLNPHNGLSGQGGNMMNTLNISGGSSDIRWTDQSLQRGPSVTGPWTQVAYLPIGTPVYQDTRSNPSTNYYRIFYEDIYSQTSVPLITGPLATICTGAPNAPRLVCVKSGASDVGLSWNNQVTQTNCSDPNPPSTGAMDSFEVYGSSNPQGSWDSSSRLASLSGSTITYAHTNGQQGAGVRYYQVRGKKNGIEGP